MNFKSKKITKSLVVFLCVSFFMTSFGLSFLTPKKVEAQAFVPVVEVGGNLATNLSTTAFAGLMDWKEFIADGVVWVIVKDMVKNAVIDKILDKVSSLFGGIPAFIEDPFQFLKDLEKDVANKTIDNVLLSDLTDIKTLFGTNIETILKDSHIPGSIDTKLDEIFKPTIETVVNTNGNFNQFKAGNFYQGGWEGFFSLTQNSKNNPYGAYLLAEQAVAQAQQEKESSILNELDWGDGFLSDRDGGLITLPGQTISNQLNEALGNSLRTLEHADELTEAVALLAGMLIDNIFNSGGLSGGGSYKTVNPANYDKNPDLTVPDAGSFASSTPGGGSVVSLSGTVTVLDIDNGSFLAKAGTLLIDMIKDSDHMDMMSPTNNSPDSTIRVGAAGEVSIPSLKFVRATGGTINLGGWGPGTSVPEGEVLTFNNVTVKNPVFGTLSNSKAENTGSITYSKIIEEVGFQADATGARLTDVTLSLDKNAVNNTDFINASITGGVGSYMPNLTNINSIMPTGGTFPGDILRGGISQLSITLNNVRLLGGTVVTSTGATYSISNPSDNLYCGMSICNYNQSTSGITGPSLYIHDDRNAWAIRSITWSDPKTGSVSTPGFEVFGGTVVGP